MPTLTLKSDALTAVKENWRNIRGCSTELRSDPDVVFAAFTSNKGDQWTGSFLDELYEYLEPIATTTHAGLSDLQLRLLRAVNQSKPSAFKEFNISLIDLVAMLYNPSTTQHDDDETDYNTEIVSEALKTGLAGAGDFFEFGDDEARSNPLLARLAIRLPFLNLNTYTLFAKIAPDLLLDVDFQFILIASDWEHISKAIDEHNKTVEDYISSGYPGIYLETKLPNPANIACVANPIYRDRAAELLSHYPGELLQPFEFETPFNAILEKARAFKRGKMQSKYNFRLLQSKLGQTTPLGIDRIRKKIASFSCTRQTAAQVEMTYIMKHGLPITYFDRVNKIKRNSTTVSALTISALTTGAEGQGGGGSRDDTPTPALS